MGARKIGSSFDFAREQHEVEFVEAHQDLLFELSSRMGVMAGHGDKRGLALMTTALNNLCRLAFSEYEARHGQAEQPLTKRADS
jgi:hypothetical protein